MAMWEYSCCFLCYVVAITWYVAKQTATNICRCFSVKGRYKHAVEWTTGMDYWNGILDWTTGLSFFSFLWILTAFLIKAFCVDDISLDGKLELDA